MNDYFRNMRLKNIYIKHVQEIQESKQAAADEAIVQKSKPYKSESIDTPPACFTSAKML